VTHLFEAYERSIANDDEVVEHDAKHLADGPSQEVPIDHTVEAQ